MGQYDFKKDIKQGIEGEKIIQKFLESKGFSFIESCNTNAYDLKMSLDGVKQTFEVKTDVFDNTGNLAIEIESWGKPSGIEVTSADFFVYYLYHLGEVWIMDTEELKAYIGLSHPRKVMGGDRGSNTWMYLLPKRKLPPHFKVFKLN